MLFRSFSKREREALLGTQKDPAFSTYSRGFDRVGFGDISRRELAEYLGNVLLRDTDCFGMACSLEIREPFLHIPLVSQVLEIPDRWKLKGAGLKPLLIAALRDLLPPAIRARAKRGFVLPFTVWLRSGPLREEVERTLTDRSGQGNGVFEAAVVRSVWDEFVRGRTSWNRVWALYALQRWIDANLAGT